MAFYEKIFENNKQWAAKKTATDKDFFKKLSSGQSPEILFIGCSDSRVTAEVIMGAGPGEVFVHRNVANLVPNNDHNSAAVIEYAVGHLHVKHIIICGHYLCGGVKAAMETADLGALNPWLRNIKDVYRLHKNELESISDETARYNLLVELNVQEQCINITKMAVWQKSLIEHGWPEIHGLVFDLKSGKLIDLNIDISGELAEVKKLYDLGI